jgi:hypothetical protein
VNCAEDVAVDREDTSLGGGEDYSVRIPKGNGHASVEVVCYREAVGLRLVKIANQEANYLRFSTRTTGQGCAGAP